MGEQSSMVRAVGERPGLAELCRVFLRISLLGFGGPNAHIALMLDELVERRRWLTREHFLQLVAITNLLPGPNSSEVAIHIGYTQRGWRGALTTGLSFLAPTFIFVVVLSHLYFRYGTLPAAEGLFWGLKPVIVAIIIAAGWKLGRAAVTDVPLTVLAIGGLATAILLDRWEVLAMALGGMVTWALQANRAYRQNAPSSAHPESLAPPEERASGDESPHHACVLFLPLIAVAGAGELLRLLWLMLWSGAVLFGGGYMLVALLQPYVVGAYGWLTAQQFLDGIALTQAVPGPIVTLVAFVGYAVGGVPGAAIATFGIYVPSFTAVLLVAPHMERWRRQQTVRAILRGVNAVVAGAILGVAVTLLPPAVPDILGALLLAGALVAQFAFNVGAVWVVAGGLAAGVIRILVGS
jgi:chromate transporter